jgi:hypothetical protein
MQRAVQIIGPFPSEGILTSIPIAQPTPFVHNQFRSIAVDHPVYLTYEAPPPSTEVFCPGPNPVLRELAKLKQKRDREEAEAQKAANKSPAKRRKVLGARNR